MSNDLILDPNAFKGVAVPTVLKHLRAQDDKLGALIGLSYGILHYAGKTWSLQYQGKRQDIVVPDGPYKGAPVPFIDVVIVGHANAISKSWYEKWDPNAQGAPPDCASADGTAPDAGVLKPQSQFCKTCARNQFKTDPVTGDKRKECSDYMRLAVALQENFTAPLFGGVPLREPIYLRIPPASLSNLAKLWKLMADGQGLHHATYVTRISFDPSKTHPKLVFQAVRGLTEAEGAAVDSLLTDPVVDRICNGAIVLPDRDAAQVVSSQPVHVPSPTPQPTSQKPLANPGNGLATAPIDVEYVDVAPQAPPGTAAASAPVTAPVTSAPNGAVDTEESDADLDARIANKLSSLTG